MSYKFDVVGWTKMPDGSWGNQYVLIPEDLDQINWHKTEIAFASN